MMVENDISEGMVLMIKGILNGMHRHLDFLPDLDKTTIETAVDRFLEDDVARRSGHELFDQFSTQEKCLKNFLEYIRTKNLS